MFMGEYHPTMDEKGRVAIPMKLRRAFGESEVIEKLVITHVLTMHKAFRERDWSAFVEQKLLSSFAG
jgi:DNA-binding transcriptional regulator/RsmH inhibitor MraZ